MKKQLIITSLLLPLFACGGGGGDNPPATLETQTGVFLDSPVINMGYRTETKSGVTNSLGEYKYLPGETVTFFIGALEFPPTTAKATVTPLDLANTKDTSEPVVVNMIRLLQTLDQDAIPENGITINDTATSVATEVDFTLSVSDFESSSAVTTLIPNAGQDSSVTALISADEAISNFEDELTDKNITYGTSQEGVWELPGSDVIFMYLPDGRYFAIQWEEDNGFIGFERGTYIANSDTLTFSTLQNNDGEALICSEPSDSTCPNEAWDFSVSGDNLALNQGEESATFDSVTLSGSGIQGIWELPGESVIFMYLPDGRYFAVQWESDIGATGFERGTYIVNNDTLTFSTLQNNDGEVLICGEPKDILCSSSETWDISISGDNLTLNQGEESPKFDRLF